jgi:mRNA interferase MazF
MNPQRGEIWLADLDPIRGREQAGRRPLLVVSVAEFNRSGAELVVALPITTNLREIPWHVRAHPPEGGLKAPSAIMCEAIRSVSKSRLERRWGVVSRETMDAVEDRLRILLSL